MSRGRLATFWHVPHIDVAADFETPSNIIAIHSVNKPVAAMHSRLYAHLCWNPKAPLSRVECESLAAVVSIINDCYY